jgi:hypothetical protein
MPFVFELTTGQQGSDPCFISSLGLTPNFENRSSADRLRHFMEIMDGQDPILMGAVAVQLRAGDRVRRSAEPPSVETRR